MDASPRRGGQNLRHEYLVDRRFQMRFARFSGLVASFSAGAVAVTAALAFGPRVEAAEGRAALLLTLAVGLLASALVGLLGLVWSHRLAGPIFVMTRHLATFARGQYPTMRPLRRGDAFSDLFDLLQKSLEAMQARDLEEGARILDAVERLSPHATSPESKQSLEALMAIHSRKIASAPAEAAIHPRRTAA